MLDSDEAQPSKQADVYALSMVAMEVFTGTEISCFEYLGTSHS